MLASEVLIAVTGMMLTTHSRKYRYARLTTLLSVVAVWALALVIAYGPVAKAQSSDDSGLGVEAAPGDAESGDDSASVDTSNDWATTASPATAEGSAPTASDEASAPSGPSDAANDVAEADNGQTLEVPQVIDPTSLKRQDTSSNEAPNQDDADADPTQATDPTAASEASSALPGPVGTIQDYEDQASEAPAGVVVFVPGAAVPLSSYRPLAMGPRPLTGTPMFAGMTAAAPIILQPTSAGPLISTSPMLMPPPLSFSRPGGVAGGWWTRTRR